MPKSSGIQNEVASGNASCLRISVSLIGRFLYLYCTMFSSEIRSVHFAGIGGTAMASAAAAMQDNSSTSPGRTSHVIF
jgi:hypothetical protein